MNKKILKKILLVSILIFLVLPNIVQSQNVTEQLRMRLEQTDDILERARETVFATNSPHAKVAYEQAVELQRRAWQLFRMGPGNNNYINANNLTLKARQKAADALKAARITVQSESAVLQRLERAENILDRVRQLAGNDGNNYQNLVDIYTSTRHNLDLAWEFYRSGQYKPAYKLANQVINASEKLLKRVNQYIQSKSNYERRMEAVRDYYEMVEGVISECSSQKAHRLVEQAKEVFQKAESLASEQHYIVALKNLQTAKSMVRKALKECRGVKPLEQRYEKLLAKAERLSDKIPSNDDMAQRLLAQAYDQLRLAKDKYEKNKADATVAALKAAQLTLERLETHIRSNSGR